MNSQSFDQKPQSLQVETNVNMTGTERNASTIGGTLLLGAALMRRGWMGLGLGALGAALLYQGGTGISHIYKMLNVNRAVNNPTAAVSVPHQQGKHATASITINRPVEEVFAFWRNFHNLPRFMTHLQSVEVQDDTRSQWSIKGPGGTTITWGAEIINVEPNTVIGWRTLENPYVNHAGSVRFKSAPQNQGTEVRVEMEYLPVGGAAGMMVANLLGYSPQQSMMESLRRLKQLLEVGTFSTTEGQSSADSSHTGA